MFLTRLLLPGDLEIVSRRKASLKFRRAVFLDLDGTLWPDTGPGSILRDGRIEPRNVDLLLRISRKGYLLIGLSNQTFFGYQVKTGVLPLIRYRNKLQALVTHGPLDSLYVCHHHPHSNIRFLKADCSRRKPDSGMLLAAMKADHVEPRDSFAIGDKITDIFAAEQVGVSRKFLISNSRSLEWNVSNSTKKPRSINFYLANSLEEALNTILDQKNP